MRERRKLFSWVSVVILVILVIPMIRVHIFSGGEIRPITLSPEKRMEKLLNETVVYKGFEDENFQIYYVKQQNEFIPYAYSRHAGIWVEDASVKRKQVVSSSKEKLYFYGEDMDIGTIMTSVSGETFEQKEIDIENKKYVVYVIEGYQKGIKLK